MGVNCGKFTNDCAVEELFVETSTNATPSSLTDEFGCWEHGGRAYGEKAVELVGEAHHHQPRTSRLRFMDEIMILRTSLWKFWAWYNNQRCGTNMSNICSVWSLRDDTKMPRTLPANWSQSHIFVDRAARNEWKTPGDSNLADVGAWNW